MNFPKHYSFHHKTLLDQNIMIKGSKSSTKEYISKPFLSRTITFTNPYTLQDDSIRHIDGVQVSDNYHGCAITAKRLVIMLPD